MASSIAAIVCVLSVFSSIAPSLATTYTVGDTRGWTSGVDYDGWAKGKTFKVGDILMFNFGTSHTVDEVSEKDYKSCTTGNSLSSEKSGPTSVTLTAGSHYYICGVPGHCDNGMKLSVNVGAAAPSGSSASDSPATKNTNTPSSPSSNNTPESSSAVTLSSLVGVFSCLFAIPLIVFS